MIITGDIHADFTQFNTFINKKKPETIICCGDFGYWPIYNDKRYKNDVDLLKPQNTKIYWCDGNHEQHDLLDELVVKNGRQPIEVAENVFYVPRGCVLTFNDKNFLFMGGADSIDKQYRKIKIDWFPQEIVSEKDLSYIEDKKIDVVISHTCPYDIVNQCILKNPGYASKFNDPSSRALQVILEEHKPKEWFFGHWHTYFKTKYMGCSFTCLNMFNNSNWWVEYGG